MDPTHETPDLSLIQANVAGVDEAGRGPLAGPVVAAAVILHPTRAIAGLRDSKCLRPQRREELAVVIRARAAAWAVAEASVEEIDQQNILRASLLAMSRALAALSVTPRQVLIDGCHCPPDVARALAVVKGDQRIAAISAASILAKVHRDALMCELDRRHPGYGFDCHFGYPTRAHLDSLARLGPCTCHRRTFAPVRLALQRGSET